MSGRWSREDLLRAFDLLTKAEQEIRASDQPRYNLEMALLRLMHLRKLVPLSDLLTGAAVSRAPKAPEVPRAGFSRTVPSAPRPVAAPQPVQRTENPSNRTPGTSGTPGTIGTPAAIADGFKDRFLAELKASKATFYNLVVASAFSIDATPAGVTIAFLPNHKNAKSQCEEQKAWLQSVAEKIAGKPIPVAIVVANAAAPAAPAASASAREPSGELRRDPAPVDDPMNNSTVQAVLEIFPVEKTTVEER
jgi:DNA polymerase-3 subunit gamma/tau